MTCLATVGLLILRPCGEPATGFCGQCGKALCATHQLGDSCPDCAATDPDPTASPEVAQAASRRSFFQQYGAPPQFGDRGYFSGADRAALLGAAAASPRRPPEDYDPLET
jgi:hypothetical protein